MSGNSGSIHPSGTAPDGARGIRPTKSSIVCGTDFSEGAAVAVEAAAAWAKRLSEPLVLVHSVDEQQRKYLPGELQESLTSFTRAQLHGELERWRALEVEVVEALRVGGAEAVLLEEAASRMARLLVLPAGKRRGNRLLAGDFAERVAESAPIPTLVVRDPQPLVQWAENAHKLRIFVGADFSAPSEAALRWVEWLRQVGPCDVIAAYLETGLPPAPASEVYPSLFMDDMAQKTARLHARYFRQRVRALLAGARVRIRLEKDWGRSDAHLIQMASEEHADLIVVGTHSRHGWARLGHHSVSRGVLHYAPTNVACVPPGTPVEGGQPFRRHPPTIHPQTP